MTDQSFRAISLEQGLVAEQISNLFVEVSGQWMATDVRRVEQVFGMGRSCSVQLNIPEERHGDAEIKFLIPRVLGFGLMDKYPKIPVSVTPRSERQLTIGSFSRNLQVCEAGRTKWPSQVELEEGTASPTVN